MKTRKLNKKTGVESLVIVGSLMVGFMASGAIDAAVPTDKRTIARVGTAGAGAAGAALLPSTDTTTTALKMLSAGAAARASYMLVTDELKNQVTVKADATTLDKAMYGAIGLACPCDGSRDFALNAPLDYPELNVQTLDTTWSDAEQNYQVDKGGFAA
ncbi:hypothetical protein ACFSYG_11930 [Leeuwenhoekiella polynyae]|uniref:Uncharacterized protein n=1 Tax=Leeuwenhoekiella polynyae TaxID=1550906 RepID=A0A4Q0PFL9_9FLAO|nr:hypothetical protein [Leeuwenhoekiella polynyae]RXG25695.1 hypothetical protein DSM02_862 [Leeuwenhoekiella polynyae]